MFVHLFLLTQVNELLITQLHIFSINFINGLSYYHCIRYLVFPPVFMSILFYGRLLYFQAHVTYVTLKIALNIQVGHKESNKQ